MDWITVIIAIALIILTIVGITNTAFHLMTRMRPLSYHQTFRLLEKAGLYTRQKFDELPKKEVRIQSRDGLQLNGIIIEDQPDSSKWMIIVHGYRGALPASLPFMEMFREDGFNILLIDQRRHGRSEGKYTSYGYFEKYDIADWIQWIMMQYGTDCTIGLHGLSLGGGTVLEYLSTENPKAAFVIADCPYSDLTRLMHHQMQRLNRIPAFAFLPLVNGKLRRKAGFSLGEVSPIRSVANSPVPVMFIHGTEDHYIPTVMSKEMYAAKAGPKKLLLIEGASHGNAFEVNPVLYKKSVQSFVHEALQTAAASETVHDQKEGSDSEDWMYMATSRQSLPQVDVHS